MLVMLVTNMGEDGCLMLGRPVAACVGAAVRLAVAGGVFDGVFLCCLFSH